MTHTLFDKSTVFNQRVASIANRLNQVCTENQIPMLVSLTLGAVQQEDNTNFSVLASVGGTLEMMPIEQMIGAALVNPEFMQALSLGHTRFMLALVTMPPEHAQSEHYRADFRAAVAYVATRGLIERAKEQLHQEAESVRGMSEFFQNMTNEALSHHENPDAAALPSEYMDFIDTLFKGKPNG